MTLVLMLKSQPVLNCASKALGTLAATSFSVFRQQTVDSTKHDASSVILTLTANVNKEIRRGETVTCRPRSLAVVQPPPLREARRPQRAQAALYLQARGVTCALL